MSSKNTDRSVSRPMYAWKFVFVFLVLFFPLGIYLAAVNLSSQKDKRIRNGLILGILGLLLCIWMVFSLRRAMPGGRFDLQALSKSMGSSIFPLCIWLVGLSLIVLGCMLFFQGRQDTLLLTYLKTDQILDLEDLTLLLYTGPAGCFDRIERLVEDHLLEDRQVCYSAQKPVLLPKSGNPRSVRVSDYLQDPAYSGPYPPSEKESKCAVFLKKILKKEVPSLVNTLWVTGAVISCLGGVFLLLPGLLLSALAAGLEYKKYLRRNPCIIHCALYSFLFICFMTSVLGLGTLSSVSGSDGARILTTAYLPTLLLCLFDLASYTLLTRRARRYYRYLYMIREEENAGEEDMQSFCGFRGQGLQRAKETLIKYGFSV